jgi:hypothetical protein
MQSSRCIFNGFNIEVWMIAGKESFLEPQRNVYEPNERRHFDQWANNGRESCSGVYSENRDCDGNRQLEVVTCGSK